MRLIDLNKGIIAVGLSLLGTAFIVSSASSEKQIFKTSFDCTKVQSEVEIKICDNKQLADSDREMASLYKGLLADLPASDKDQLKHEQRAWLKTRAFCNSSNVIIDCLEDVYAKRIGALKGKKEALESPANAETPTLSNNIDIPYTIRKGELQVLGHALRSEEITAKEDEYYVSFRESPNKRWVIIGYDEPFEKTLVWLYDRTTNTAPVSVKAKRVGKHFGVDWYGDSVFAVYWGGMGYKTSQLFSAARPAVYTQIESIVEYDPVRDLYARFDFDKQFNFYVIVGRAFHPQAGEEKFPVKLHSDDLITAIGSIENVRFGGSGITIRYQSKSGVVTETHSSTIVERARQ